MMQAILVMCVIYTRGHAELHHSRSARAPVACVKCKHFVVPRDFSPTYPPLEPNSPLSCLHPSCRTPSLCWTSFLWHSSSLSLFLAWLSSYLLCHRQSTGQRKKNMTDLALLNSRLQQNSPLTLADTWTWKLCWQTVKVRTSSSLSDVSESVEAAGLLTGSSCSPESTRFLFARDKSSWKIRFGL